MTVPGAGEEPISERSVRRLEKTTPLNGKWEGICPSIRTLRESYQLGQGRKPVFTQGGKGHLRGRPDWAVRHIELPGVTVTCGGQPIEVVIETDRGEAFAVYSVVADGALLRITADACPADTNDDDFVNTTDLLNFINNWGACP